MITSPPTSRRASRPSEGGYILLALLLTVALLTIAAAAIAPSIAFQVKRDREEELIHRGVQYSRAVQHYYKKFNRYPTKIEDLESTNNLRFLRKRYKDPITGTDFKVLYLSQVQAALGGVTPGAALGLNPSGTSGSQSGQPGGGFGGGSFGAAQSAFSANGAGGAAKTTAGAGTDQSTSASEPGDTDTLSGKTFGGGPIAGVVSTSKLKSIREFNKKDHYNEWFFIYNPQMDRGGLLNTPSQPALAGAAPIGQPAGAVAPGAGFGNQGFGNQGIGNQGSQFGGGMQPAQPIQPQQPPQQQ
ncbi:MAG: hypothetical protein ACRD2U_08260 [Terriglobales bacterium]